MIFRLLLLQLSLLLATALPISSTFAATAPVEGSDYVLIENGKPYQPLAGKIEVTEVFSYGCHHCADFQPMIDAWKQQLPANVRFSYVPAAFDVADPFAKAYFAAENQGVLGKTHNALFRAIHDDQSLPKNATAEEIAGFYAQQGIGAAKMLRAMRDPALTAKLQYARQFQIDSGVEGTPSLIINGKYRVMGRTLQDSLRITDQLIAQLARRH